MGKSKEFRVGDGRKKAVYIDWELDDYGLTPVEFRVYGRIARRSGQVGECSESAANMASAFGVGEKTVDRVLLVLVETRLARKQIRPGTTNLYWLNDKSEWLPSSQLQSIRDRIHRNTGKRKGKTEDTPTLPQNLDRGHPTSETEDDPGTPPPNGLVHIDSSLVPDDLPLSRLSPAHLAAVTVPPGFSVASSSALAARPTAKRHPRTSIVLPVRLPDTFEDFAASLTETEVKRISEGVDYVKDERRRLSRLWFNRERFQRETKFKSRDAIIASLQNYILNVVQGSARKQAS